VYGTHAIKYIESILHNTSSLTPYILATVNHPHCATVFRNRSRTRQYACVSCRCTYAHTRTHTRVHTHIHTHVLRLLRELGNLLYLTDGPTHTRALTHAHTDTHTVAAARTWEYAVPRRCIYTHTRTHACTHTYTHTVAAAARTRQYAVPRRYAGRGACWCSNG